MIFYSCEAGVSRGSQRLMHSLSFSFMWCYWLAAFLILASYSLSVAARPPDFPAQPVDIDQASWTALQSVVAKTILTSTELAASDGATGDDFGFSVALSGTTALVGVINKTVNSHTSQGAAYAFTSNGGTWVQQQELTASDGAANDYFGYSVALSGTTALVAAYAQNNGQGRVYVFTLNGSTWVQQQALTASDGAAGDGFGSSVALSGNAALVGALDKTIGLNEKQGAAYVFTSSGGIWSQQQELTANDGAAGDTFGCSVSLSGTTALVGAALKTIGSNSSQGAAYVFTSNGSAWVQQQELTASDGAAHDVFARSVALSGATALVGAVTKTIGSNSAQGAAYVFMFNGATWSQQQELTASDGAASDRFGSSVALSGPTALVGAFLTPIGSNIEQGAAYMFTSNGSTWVQQQELTASDGAAIDEFGNAVALSGTTALIGALYKQVGANYQQGAAYVFEASDTIFCDGFDGTGVCM